MNRLIFNFLIIAIALAGISCSDEPQHDEPMNFGLPDNESEKILNCDEAQLIFNQQLQPELITSCQKCHGVDHVPLFAVEDSEAAFKRVLPWMNFQNPQISQIIINSSNNHCRDRRCKKEKPKLNEAVLNLANEINICRSQSEKEPVDPEIAFQYFRSKVRPTLEHHCARCHGKTRKAKPIDGIIKRFFKAPRYLMGNSKTVYIQAKKYLFLDKDTFYASPLYGTAAFPHFNNGDCKNLPKLAQEEQSPCKQIIKWWELEKEYLDSIQDY